MFEFFSLLKAQVLATSWLEWMALIFGVTEVLLARANKIWLYPAGLIGSACGITLMLEVGLYAEAGLSFYYVVMSIYGWWYWKRRINDAPVRITATNKREWRLVFSIIFLGWVGIYLFLEHFTNSTVPILDAFVSATAWAGTWLLSKRKLENWLLLNVSNIVAIPLLFYKHLSMMALLTTFLFVVAIFGYLDWFKQWTREREEEINNPLLNTYSNGIIGK